MFCRLHTNPVRLPVPAEFSECECLAIDLRGSLSYRVICAYRPPNSSVDQSVQLYRLLHYFCDTPLPVVLIGDFNLPHIEWARHDCPGTTVYSEFMNLVNTNSLVQKVLVPTRLENILDLVLCTDELSISGVSIEPGFGHSDHSVVHFQLLANKVAGAPEKPIYARNFRKADIATAKLMLSAVQWKQLFCKCSNVTEMWTAFKNQMDVVFSSTVPCMRIGSAGKRTYPPRIRRLFAKKHLLYRKWKRLGSAEAKKAYRVCCRECSSAIRNWRTVRERDILTCGNRGKFYRYVNEQRTLRTGVAPLNGTNGSLAVTDSEKAAVLGTQFCSVFTVDNGRLPDITSGALPCTTSLCNFVISSESVRKVLCTLPMKYGDEPEGIPSAILHLLSYELAQPLAIIFSQSLISGILPDSWKVADITPVFKKGSASEPANYRPVSVTSSICRVFEKILVDHLFCHIRKHSLISDEQYGFVKRRSTELQLLTCVDSWAKALDSKLSTDIVLVDFAKAFDSVSHAKLLYKLENLYSVTGNVLRWLKSFLQGRLQRVKVGSALSEYKPVVSGVPQGSVVGPVLFLLFINDIVNVFPPAVLVALFADDLKLYMSFRYAYERYILQNSINSAAFWSWDNQLPVQPLKCAVLSIGHVEPPVYTFGQHILSSKAVVNDLGILVDRELSFKQHISSVIHKAYNSLSVLFKCFVTNDQSTFVLAYVSYVRPLLEYGTTVWCPNLHARSPLACLSSIDRLESLQRRFTHRLFRRCALPDMPYLDRLRLLKLEALELRRLKLCLTMIFKIIHGLVDAKFCDLFELSTVTTTRGHRFKLCYAPFMKSARQNSFAVAMVPIWNSLPESVVSSVSLFSFKRNLSLCNNALLKHCAFDRNL